MTVLRRIVLRLRATFFSGRLHREMDEEMRAHVDQATARYLARGMSPIEARVAARREFGNATVIASNARDARGARWVESWIADTRFALRGLRRTPLFAAVAILSVGIGVGATTAIVTIANALLLESPPGVGDADRVVTIGATRHGQRFDTFSYPTYADYARASSLAAMAALDMEPRAVSVVNHDVAQAAQSGVVTGNFFQVLEARPALGRFFGQDDDSDDNGAPVIVLSDRYWHARFGGDSSVVGRMVDVNGTPFTIVGVAAPGFQGPFVIAPDLWLPLHAWARLTNSLDLFTSRLFTEFCGIGRLAPGRAAGEAQAELSSIAARLRAANKDAPDVDGVRVAPLSLIPGDARAVVATFMLLLTVVAGMVLVIASTNVAGMLLARATVRRREVAVRLAMGASRARLVRQFATESLVLGVGAGLSGLVLAHWLVAGLMSLVPKLPIPLSVHPTIDGRVLAFTLATTILVGLLIGALPALDGTRLDLVSALKIDAGATARRHRMRSALLVAQIAVSMLLLVVAGLFGRSLLRAHEVDPGFTTRGIDIVSLDFRLAGYDSTRALEQAGALIERAAQVPGVSHAALSVMLPMSGSRMGFGSIVVDGRPGPAGHDGWKIGWNVVTPEYFATIGIPILHGRAFTAADRAGGPAVAIVNETFAKHAFGSTNVIGRTMRDDGRVITVVGVARDAKYESLDEAPSDFIYVPLSQQYVPHAYLLVRTAGTTTVAAALRRVVADLDRHLPILDQETMSEATAFSLFPHRLALLVAGSLGVVALVLALLGIYGVIAYDVAQRTREIGVRMALGAARSTIVRLVLRKALVLASTGVATGLITAFAATRLLTSFLFGVPPTDAIAFAGAALLLLGAAIGASWFPARRAARSDPMLALRAQ